MDVVNITLSDDSPIPARGTRVDARVTPEGIMDLLSHLEVDRLRDTGGAGLHDVFRRCALAVLNVGSDIDDARSVLEAYADFNIRVIQQDRGLKLEMVNAPASAFVDGKMIRGVKEHLFAVLRDIVFVGTQLHARPGIDFESPAGITDSVFHILRNAQFLQTQPNHNVIVCWGGHAVSREEYDYSKEVGYQLGLRALHVCTGCGPGAMKGPMKGATIGHAKQRIYDGRYYGITEPSIIAAEPPNALVNALVIMPDIEKRLEAFARLGHGLVIFPGGVGTMEELLYLLGILLHPENSQQVLPLILSGPPESAAYFRQIHEFIGDTLGVDAQRLYRIVIGDPQRVGWEMARGAEKVHNYRRATRDAYYFNWQLRISPEFQVRFVPTHANMATLALNRHQSPHCLASNLRRAFSGIVAGNVKAEGIRAVEQHGPFEIRAEPGILEPLDRLLASFVAERRMRLPGREYVPCYRLAR